MQKNEHSYINRNNQKSVKSNGTNKHNTHMQRYIRNKTVVPSGTHKAWKTQIERFNLLS